MKTKTSSLNRRLGGFTSFCAAFALALGLLSPSGAHAANNLATKGGDIGTSTPWGIAAPLSGNTDTWTANGQALTMPTSGETFYGGTLVIDSGSFTHGGSSSATLDTVQNLTLSGGTIKQGVNSQWNISCNGKTFTLSSGIIQSGTSGNNKNVIFQNAILAGSGSVTISSLDVSVFPTVGYVSFAGTSGGSVNLSGFSGTFSLSGNGHLVLPAISAASESFGLTINPTGTGTAVWDNSSTLGQNIAVTALALNGTSINPGLYTASSLGSGYANCFVTPADNTKTIQVGHALAYAANGGSSPPATTYWAVGATASLAAPGAMSPPSGQSFSGWSTSSGGPVTYSWNGSTFSPSSFTISAETTLYAIWVAASGSITVASTLPSALSTVQGVASSPVSVYVTASNLGGTSITVGPTTGLEFSSDTTPAWASTTTVSSTGGTLYVRLAASAAVGSYNNAGIALVSGSTSATTATTGSGNAVGNDYWISTSSGNWDTSGNWQSGGIAGGSGNTADFSQVSLTGDTTVHLETSRTIGNLIFGNTAGTPANNWILDDNGSSGANTLTLASTTPTITVNNLGTGESATISATVSGSAGLTTAGAGTLNLTSANNNYTGGTTITAGTLAIGSTGVLGSTANALTLSGGTLDLGAQTTPTVGAVSITGAATIQNGSLTGTAYSATLNSGTATITAALLGSGTLSVNNNGGSGGAVTLSGANAYTGLTTVTSGTLTISGNQPSATGGFSIGDNTVGAATLNISGTVVSTGNIKFGRTTASGSGGTGKVTAGGSVNNSGTLTVGRTGDLQINGGSWTQSADATILGNGNGNASMEVNSGSLTYSGANTFKLNCTAGNFTGNNTLTLAGGTFTTGQAFENNATETSTSRGQLTFAGGTLQFTTNVSDFIFSSTATPILCNFSTKTISTIDTGSYSVGNSTVGITGAGGLTKIGSGTLTIGAVDTYSGNTTISGGTLALSGGGTISSSPVITVKGTLDVSAVTGGNWTLNGGQTLAGTGTVNGNVTLADSATNHPGGGTMTFGNNLTFGAGAQPVFDCSSSAVSGNDQVVLTNANAALAGSGASITINQINGVNTLAATNYVLFNLTGAAGSVASDFNPTPRWLPSAPANAFHYSIFTSGKQVILTYAVPNTNVLTIETAADGSGSLVTNQTVTAGSSVTGYAIVRTPAGTFLTNTAVAWSMVNTTSGVTGGNLIAAGNNQSATFTGGLIGSGQMQATVAGYSSANSGTLTVVAGAAAQVRVETAADGSGTVVPAGTIALGGTVTGYAITRDAGGNFLANVAATWSLMNLTGTVVSGDLAAGTGNKSAVFTANHNGSAQILATVSALNPVPSGVITVGGGGSVVTVNWNTVYQQIEGFGCCSAFESGGLTAAQADELFTTNGADGLGIGLSLLRTQVQPGGTTTESQYMQLAQARGAKIWSAPWSPPAAMKSNNSTIDGSLLPSQYGAFANQLAQYVVNMKNQYGVNIYALSIQNEPDLAASHISCVYTAQQLHDFTPYLYNALASYGVAATKILMPEKSHAWDNMSMAQTTLNDPTTAAMVSILAGHAYPPGKTSAVTSHGKSVWQTESCDITVNDVTIANGLNWATDIHGFLTTASVNAWHYYNLNGSAGLGLYVNWVPTKRLYCLGNFSRFVRPGFYRIGVTNPGGALISAYKDGSSTRFAIVAINNTSTNITQTFSLSGSTTVNSVTPCVTSATLALANQTPVVVNNQSFTYTIPKQSVVTFVGQGQIASGPSISPIAEQSVNENTATPAIPFTISDGATNPTLLTVSGFSSNPALVPNANLVFGGSSSNRTVTVTPASNQSGTATISVVVSDGVLRATNSFLLTVVPASGVVTAVASGDINDLNTWGVPVPVAGDDNTWQSGNYTINLTTTNVDTFYGSTFVIQTNGLFAPGVTNAFLTLNNLVLDGGTVFMGNNGGLTLDLSGQTLTLNSGTIQTGTGASMNILIQDGVLSGSGTINITGSSANGAQVTFDPTIDTSGFTGTFNVSANGVLNLPNITADNASFGLNLTGTGVYANTSAVALTSLAIAGTNILPGIYTYANFTPAQQAFLLNNGGTITVGTPTNTPPVLAAIANATITAGQTLLITNTATDNEQRYQTLTFSLLNPPAGATIDPALGLFAWRPTIAQSPSTNSLSVVVTDDGAPPLSATQSFTATVNQPAKPTTGSAGWNSSTGQFIFSIGGDSGPDYTILVSTNLTTWLPLWTNSSPVPPFIFTDTNTGNGNQRFYRVLLGP